MSASLVGSEMCIRDRSLPGHCEVELRSALELVEIPWTIGCALVELWVAQGARTAPQVLEWLHFRLSELELARPTTDARGNPIG
eukprot:6225039-Alexandrium_andersonii.AAC.1